MAIELKVPEVGESITEVVIGEWLKQVGEAVQRDEPVVMIETDKVTVELPAPVAGVITEIRIAAGATAVVGDVVGLMEAGAAATPSAGAAPTAPAPTPPPEPAAPAPAPATPRSAPEGESRVMPAAARVAAQTGVDLADVTPTGPGGRILKEDVARHAEEAPTEASSPVTRAATIPAEPTRVQPAATGGGSREEEAVRMTPMRARIAERLVESQHTAALLTTFNEIDMSEIMATRKKYQPLFTKKYGIKLGFMSFFVRAACDALKLIPQVNAEIRGKDVVYKNYMDIGVAVGGGKGLVVPVIRNAERLGFAEIELAIADLATRAQKNRLKLHELQGGTFTISNGGIYGSLLSTPIVNPPQSGILGLHGIQDRPIALDGQVVIRPMMYIAMTYDHRVVDGREAVTFLKRIKECCEEPSRMLIEV